MANIETLLRDFGESIKSKKQLDPTLFKDKSLVDEVISAGIEDNETNPSLVSLFDYVKEAIENVSEGTEDFSEAQVKAAEYIASLSIGGVDAIKKLYGQPRKLDAGTEDNVVNNYRYGVDDDIDVGIEYFDMQNTSTNLVFNIVFNAFAPKQDEFAELFFPLVAIDPVKAGARIKATLINIWKEYKQSIDGTPAADKINEHPLIKAVTDTKLLTTDSIRLVPVYRDVNKGLFFDKVLFEEEYMGEVVKTGPLVFGKKMSLVGLAQTDSMLAKGGADFTDGINKSIKLSEIYVQMTGKDSNGNNVTETFRFSLKNRNSYFYETIIGTTKQMVLNFDEDDFFMLTPDTKAIDANGNEVDSKIMANLPANLEINLEINLTGQANIAYGDVAVFLQSVTLKDVRTKSGAKVPASSDEYQKVEAVVKTTQPGGFIIDAHASLGNAKRKGIHILTRKQTVVVTVPYRSGFTEILPVVVTGDDGDPADLVGQIMGTRMKLNAYAIKTVTDFIDDMRANPKQRIQGLSHYFVDNYFFEDELTLSKLVDSIRSSERIEDLRAAVVNKIKLVATDMILKSNYKIARDTLGYTGPIDVLVGMGLKLKLNLFGDTQQETFGDLRFNYAGTPFKELEDKIIITIGVRDNRKNDIDPLNFGVCLWSPELVINTKKTIGEGVRTEISTFPRFLHYINLAIIGVYNITDIETIASKNVYLTQEA